MIKFNSLKNLISRFILILTFLINVQFLSASALKYEYAVMGDAGEWNNDTRSVFYSLLRKNVKTLVMPGDNLYSWPWSPKTYQEVWNPWRLENFDFFAVGIGNHHGGYDAEVAYFEMPAEYYSKTVNNFVQFIVLNSDNESNARQQAKFLEDTLAQTTTPYTFLVYHHPTYTVSPFHWAQEKIKFQKEIRPIIQKYRNKITALLVGHDHVSLVAHFNDLPVVLSGSTHEQRPHLPLNYTQDGITVTTNWHNAKSALWAYLAVDESSSEARIDFIKGTTDQYMCSLTIKTGQAAKFMSNCFTNNATENSN